MSIVVAISADKDSWEAVSHWERQEPDWPPSHGDITERTRRG